MGFEGKSVIKLNFEDPSLEGLEIVTRKPTIEQIMAVGQAVEADEKAQVRATAELFVESLIGWNLTNDDADVPHNVDAFLGQDGDLVSAILDVWEDAALGRLAAPLGQSSNDGGESVEASLPMAPLSESRAS